MPTVSVPPYLSASQAFMASYGQAGEQVVSAKRIRIDPNGALAAREGFSFGADPEMFIFDSTGKAVAPTMIPGDKEDPHKVPGGAVQRDGMAAEFNIDPARTFAEFNNNIEKVMTALSGFLPDGYTAQAVPFVIFDRETFEDTPDEYKVLGCSPDWNAWEEDLNPPPLSEDPFFRAAGGHLHVGWGKDYSMDDTLHLRNCFDLIRQLDWFLGAWSLKLDPDCRRRELYGKAGSCRLKDYGVEYRTLSNFWITTTDRRLAVWNRMQMAINSMQDRFLPETAPEGYNDFLIEAINTGKIDKEFGKNCHFPLRTTEIRYAKF